MLLITLVFVVLLFFLEFFVAKNDSMEPSIYKNNFTVFSKIQKVHRSSIILYRDSSGEKQIGRIIALPNEDIIINKGDVYVNSEILKEEYLKDQATTNVEFPQVGEKLKLEDDEYFILGDNREYSYDSRYFGPIKKRDILGTLFFKI